MLFRSDRKSTRLNSSHLVISYAVFCLKKKTAAASKIELSTSPVAVVTGWCAELDSVCQALRGSYAEVWKISNQALAYPIFFFLSKGLPQILPLFPTLPLSH